MTLRLIPEDDGQVGLTAFRLATLPTGNLEFCNCGLPLQHGMIGTPCNDMEAFLAKVEEMSEQPNDAVLDRRTLRAYHRKIADFLMQAVNAEGVRYRMSNNAVILYPPDGTASITVYARNSERQLRSLRQWHDKHVTVKPEVQVPEVVVGSVTERDDPVPTPAEVHVHPVAVEEFDAALLDEGDWTQHFSDNGDPVEGFETNGLLWRCRICMGTQYEYVASHPTGIGGHRRMVHGDTTDLFSAEARAKAVDSKRFNRLSRQIEEAVLTLAKSIGWQAGPADEAEIVALREQVAALTKRAEDAEARLAIIREGLNA